MRGLQKVAIGVLVMMAPSILSAQELVYAPVNPSFGGNSFNSSHLLAIANAQNDFERPTSDAAGSSDLDRFVRSLQSRLLSSLSNEVANAIFGEDAQDSGRIEFGDQTVEFVRTLDGIRLTITEPDGSQTVITVPTLVTGEAAEGVLSPGAAPLTGAASLTGIDGDSLIAPLGSGIN